MHLTRKSLAAKERRFQTSVFSLPVFSRLLRNIALPGVSRGVVLIHDARCMMQDARCMMQDARCMMQDARSMMQMQCARAVWVNFVCYKDLAQAARCGGKGSKFCARAKMLQA